MRVSAETVGRWGARPTHVKNMLRKKPRPSCPKKRKLVASRHTCERTWHEAQSRAGFASLRAPRWPHGSEGAAHEPGGSLAAHGRASLAPA